LSSIAGVEVLQRVERINLEGLDLAIALQLEQIEVAESQCRAADAANSNAHATIDPHAIVEAVAHTNASSDTIVGRVSVSKDIGNANGTHSKRIAIRCE